MDSYDQLDAPPAQVSLEAPDVPKIAFVAAMVAFVVLAVGNALGQATTILALLLCGVALAIGLAVLLPRQWAGWAAASAYVVAGALLVIS